MYNYKAKLNRVVDGDTVNLTIDLGFRLSYTANCRLAGINAPELKNVDGIVSHGVLSALLSDAKIVDIISTGLDKYGRPLVIVKANGTDINIKMITQGFAVKM
jgi:micrococcal nuclease